MCLICSRAFGSAWGALKLFAVRSCGERSNNGSCCCSATTTTAPLHVRLSGSDPVLSMLRSFIGSILSPLLSEGEGEGVKREGGGSKREGEGVKREGEGVKREGKV